MYLMRSLHIIHVSDIHGWIYGLPDTSECGDLGNLLSYYERVNLNISEIDDVLFIYGGDDC